MEPDLIGFFSPWIGHGLADRFLRVEDHPSGAEITVDVMQLMATAPMLSGGEQVYAAVWWCVVRGAPAPWLDEPLAKLGQLDNEHVRRIGALFDMLSRLRPS